MQPALKRAAKRAVRAATDRGWFGLEPLDTHVVISGWPRAGTTLLEQIVHLCVDDVWTWPEEVPALWAARDAHRDQRFMCTKDPRDVARIHAIRDHYRGRRGRAHHVIVVRDPRAVLTSTHDGYPPSRGYYCETERWRAVWQLFQTHRDDPDVTVVRYEELVRDPDAVQAALTAAIGWDVRVPFRDFHTVADPERLDDMTRGALGGLRPLDPSTIGRWRTAEHRDRLEHCLAVIPELPSALAELGYAEDDTWLAELAS